MPNLREHAKDPAIGAVSQANLELAADILAAHARRLKIPVLGWLWPHRRRRLDVELTAAVFARVRGVPEPLAPQFSSQVATRMEQDGYA